MKKEIVIAGGCFWGMQAFFAQMDGVIEVKAGYANSDIQNPTYEEVKSHLTSAVEAIKIIFDDSVVNLSLMFSYLFKIIDVTSVDHQGGDFGHQYRSGIYYQNEEDHSLALSMIKELQSNYKDKVAIEVLPLQNFSPAEEYHQNYLTKNPRGYCHINLAQLDKKHKKQDKTSLYKEAILNLRGLLDETVPNVTNFANSAALLKEKFPYFSWVGFYLADDSHLYLGPFQGKPACLKIDFDKGICGKSFSKRETIIIKDVHVCPHHIACDSDTNSEIVVPLYNQKNALIGVLDVDSFHFAAFDEQDKIGLEAIVQLLQKVLD
ncbi:MAG: peptide-methionine (S)-S-oxide reductase MsrA [Bacilli bacterium]